MKEQTFPTQCERSPVSLVTCVVLFQGKDISLQSDTGKIVLKSFVQGNICIQVNEQAVISRVGEWTHTHTHTHVLRPVHTNACQRAEKIAGMYLPVGVEQCRTQQA